MAERPKGNYISFVKQASSITFFIDDIKITLTDTIVYQKESNNQYGNLQKLFSSLQLLLPFHLLTNDKYELHLWFLFLFDLHCSVLQVLVTMVMASHTEVMQPKHFRVSRVSHGLPSVLIDTTGHPTTFLNWKMPAMLAGILVVKPLTAPGVTLLIVKSDGNIVILRNATSVLKVETFVAL